ncbi:hypothetical protein RhiirA5_412122 [Rhizophagus irregularis]|uniref:Uncharacterized protein n=1 Tax=Rhizophagus irregularis TaxID=588596 RepID=A0A2I1EGC7_9GLOM|nr:hypothetical protein RhiirA5_414164 [Rhizophagus irregularis]PKC12200.1 hypothetical protein RhiirA5_412122 [Rhizophagus irregularis]PKC71535.1 hypothetical protein RhiirA1_453448 [Rhizophagus irregularis]PKY21177.1 hypothetical protein RhiirB3_434688 [Rhizophagus irregularis]CAB5209924.1 unnamed protein product [Rhizophagus irregularis]
MSTTTATVEDKVKGSVKEFQEISKSSFEKNVEEIQKKLKGKDIDELEDYINKKFDELDQAFKKKSISIQESCT